MFEKRPKIAVVPIFLAKIVEPIASNIGSGAKNLQRNYSVYKVTCIIECKQQKKKTSISNLPIGEEECFLSLILINFRLFRIFLEITKEVMFNNRRPKFYNQDDPPIFIRSLIEKCWEDNPIARPTLKEITKAIRVLNRDHYS